MQGGSTTVSSDCLPATSDPLIHSSLGCWFVLATSFSTGCMASGEEGVPGPFIGLGGRGLPTKKDLQVEVGALLPPSGGRGNWRVCVRKGFKPAWTRRLHKKSLFDLNKSWQIREAWYTKQGCKFCPHVALISG